VGAVGVVGRVRLGYVYFGAWLSGRLGVGWLIWGVGCYMCGV